jgi:hypothetical protein
MLSIFYLISYFGIIFSYNAINTEQVLFESSKNCNISQIHISQGITPHSMTISWITPKSCYSNITYGTNKKSLDSYSYGYSTTYSYVYELNSPKLYTSGYIHHVLIDKLKPTTQYFYECGDSKLNVKSELLNFTTLPEVGDDSELSFGIIGDLGQTVYSKSTINHLLNDKSISMILHAGDLSYADCNQQLWDSYGKIIEPLSKRVPWMVCAGNHEIEFNGTNYDGLYTAFENRYKMPQVKEAMFGSVIIHSEIIPTNNYPYCTPSVFQSEYNYGNSFYSFENGLAHIIYLNPYSNTNYSSPQYSWLKKDLDSIDRNISPWIIVIMHCPWYSSNIKHHNDLQTLIMRESMEDLFYKYSVNIVFSGHVHSYERTYPVFQNKTNKYGTVYITIGDGGNLEGLDNKYYEKPEWSAFRNGTQYGHGKLTILNKNKLYWKWYRNNDNQLIFKDELLLYNSINL